MPACSEKQEIVLSVNTLSHFFISFHEVKFIHEINVDNVL